MTSTSDMILLAGVFSLLFVSLILLIVLGAQSFSTFNQLGTSLSNAFSSVLLSLNEVTNSVLQSLESFANTAIQLFENVATSLGSTFTNITKFIRTEFAGAITNVGQTTISLAAQVTRTLTNGLVGTANAAVALFQSAQLIVLQAVQLVSTSLLSVTAFIFSILSAGLSFLFRLIFGVVACVAAPIVCAINCIRPVFGIIYCVVCAFCCGIAHISTFNCSLQDVNGASCCGMTGCNSCHGGQFTVCNNPQNVWPTIAIPSSGNCVFGGGFTCFSFCS
jgi:phage-related protein